jgi:hypothetical protein
MTSLLFRDETTAVEKKAQQKWRTRAKPRKPTNDLSFEEYMDGAKFSGFAMTIDIFECARNRFFFDYPLPSDDPDHPHKGVLDYLPDYLKNAPPGSCLPPAVAAVSFANFHRRVGQSSSKTLVLAGKAYGEALALVSAATQDKAQAASDHVVMAVHLLGIYEVGTISSFLETG